MYPCAHRHEEGRRKNLHVPSKQSCFLFPILWLETIDLDDGAILSKEICERL